MTAPVIPKEIMEWLETLVGDPCPRMDATDREVWARVGQVHLVRAVRAEYDRQTSNILLTR